MRVALVVAVVVALVLILVIVSKAAQRAARRHKERLELSNKVQELQNLTRVIENEVIVQETAGYSDVTAFRHIINVNKEILP